MKSDLHSGLYGGVAPNAHETLVQACLKSLLADGEDVGFVTSGTFSPTFKKALALALVRSDLDAESVESLAVDVRGRAIACHVTPFPFLQARTKGDPRAERTLP